MHATLRLLFLGTLDEGSALCKLSENYDVLQLIWSLVNQAWERELLSKAMGDDSKIAFAHVENVTFPPPKGRYVNMMPFIMGKRDSLPEDLHDYWNMIQMCVKTLRKPKAAGESVPPPKERVGYLTVHESVVQETSSQRRPGLHTEGFTRAPYDCGNVLNLPRWHPWGFGSSMGNGSYEGGIFMASTVSDSCHVYNAIVPPELVGKGGDVEHLRDLLNEHLPDPPKRRTHWPEGRRDIGDHAGCARGHMHLTGDDICAQQPVRGAISLQAGELVWMTDRTPHESMPLEAGQKRQFFRLVTGGIDTWFAAHSTPSPLGVQPEATIVDFDKFTGPPAAVSGEQPQGASCDETEKWAPRKTERDAESDEDGAEEDGLTAEDLFGSDVEDEDDSASA